MHCDFLHSNLASGGYRIVEGYVAPSNAATGRRGDKLQFPEMSFPSSADPPWGAIVFRAGAEEFFFDVGILQRSARMAERFFRGFLASPPRSTLEYSNATPTRLLHSASGGMKFVEQDVRTKITSMLQFDE
jgi:hypothetical protein